MRILLIRLSSLGDIVLTTPAISFIKERLPGATIDFLTYTEYAALIAHDPALDRALALPKKEILAAVRCGRVCAAARVWKAFVRDVRAYRYDHVIDLHNVTDSALAALLCKKAIRTGNTRQLLTRFFTHRLNIEERNERAETHASLLAMLTVLGSGVLPKTAPLPAIPISKIYFDAAAGQEAARFIHEHGLEGKKIAGLYPAASRDFKRWPPENYARIAESMKENFGFAIILFGAAADRALLEKLGKGTRAVIACGLALPVLAALIARLDCMLGADSGLTHIAAALDIPQVALFGHSSLLKFFPLSAKARVVCHGLACAPCTPKQAHACRTRACLAEISYTEVWREVLALVAAAFPDMPCRCSLIAEEKQS